jgi:glycosyltransferase involved in cell wall biosynthesis
VPALSIVIPTISGREESLARCIASYEDTLRDGPSHEIIQIKDSPTWPSACNKGYRQSKGDVVHFTADDLEALPSWWKRPLEHLKSHNELPAPRVFDYRPDGKFANAEDGEDGDLTWFTRIPIMTRTQYEAIGEWPNIIYYMDVWVSEKARAIGIETRMVYGYDFVHHWSQVGRVDSKENLDNSGMELDQIRRRMRGYKLFRHAKK